MKIVAEVLGVKLSDLGLGRVTVHLGSPLAIGEDYSLSADSLSHRTGIVTF